MKISSWLPQVIAIPATLSVGIVILALGGHSPATAMGALVQGAAGTPEVLLSITLVRSVPLILTGLAVATAFRAGVWNIGAEGQLYAGAVVAAWVGLSWEGGPAWVIVPTLLLFSAAAGAAWAAVAGYMKIELGVGEVITTLLLNFVAIHLTSWMVHGPLQESRGVFPQTDPIATSARLPLLVPGTRLHAGFALAMVLALALWVLFRFTVVGFRLRALGAAPEAARASGRVHARRLAWGTFLVSGALAGLAGGVEVSGVTYALYEGLSPGYGYTAIAVALLAGLHPLAVVASGTFFGALEAGAGAMQRTAGIPAAWVGGIEALLILSVLGAAVLGKRLGATLPTTDSEPRSPSGGGPGAVPLPEPERA